MGWEGFGNVKKNMKRGLGVSHGSQEWGGKRVGRFKMKHEKGCGCFMVPKSTVGRVWEG